MPGRPPGKLRRIAKALYEKPLSAQELAAWGFKPSDFDHEYVEVWPENQPAFMLFQALRTQWRTGMGGATGLDYTAVFALMRERRIPAKQRQELFDDIQAMEDAALEAMQESMERK